MKVVMLRAVDRYAKGMEVDLPSSTAQRWLQAGLARLPGGTERSAPPTPPLVDPSVEIVGDTPARRAKEDERWFAAKGGRNRAANKIATK